MKAASSFTLKNVSLKAKRNKSINNGSSMIIYEDVELNSYPEIDVEGMDAYAFETLIVYLNDILQGSKTRGSISEVQLRKPNTQNSVGEN
eukprot:CAMPEP_0205805606 /NCGR_PEP_ID=MMETSP0205-20121125/8889_1 /ASSEMBLY_ACC=CAM_ASM_000278 /TAXON_ID=36767 /ORGANISM="Euplotes focardii, Strain TN1" /LENGTH=89 /DNA_ID=CAMNT_0053077111 /DNA_START=483 /DNA_END=749 /DNA_ORIENTATION=+